jgi:hypothetical protein
MGQEPAARPDPPAEIQSLIDRNAGCNSLATQSEPIRVAQLDAQRLYFKCDAIAKDVALLRQKYQNDPRILESLDLAELPADADDLIHRRTGRNELTKTASEHPNPSHESEPARLYLKCDSVASDEAALRQRYAGDARVLKVLDGKRVRFIRIVPLKIAPQANPADTSKGPSHKIDQ